MQYLVILATATLIAQLIRSESTKAPSLKDGQPNHATPAKDFSNIDSDGSSDQLNSLWIYRPASQQGHGYNDIGAHRVVVKPAHSLTRLAKTLTLGFDPYFSKGYFEPFETRPKPVTLVAFRKNGLLPRSKANTQDSKSEAEVAELQSPFNDVSNFWID